MILKLVQYMKYNVQNMMSFDIFLVPFYQSSLTLEILDFVAYPKGLIEVERFVLWRKEAGFVEKIQV